jgi:carboxymethylenebutenolidase
MGALVYYGSNGGTALSGWLAEPQAGRGPGIVVIQEWWGLNDDIKRVAERCASAGFVALAPDLYHGSVASVPDDADRLLMGLDVARAGREVLTAVAWLRARTGRPVATLGFCMGGALSLFSACAGAADVSACVVFYGRLQGVVYDFSTLRAPVLGHFAEHDEWVNETVPDLAAGLRAQGRAFSFETYPGTQHAFFKHDGRHHDAAASALAWERTLAFLRQHTES